MAYVKLAKDEDGGRIILFANQICSVTFTQVSFEHHSITINMTNGRHPL